MNIYKKTIRQPINVFSSIVYLLVAIIILGENLKKINYKSNTLNKENLIHKTVFALVLLYIFIASSLYHSLLTKSDKLSTQRANITLKDVTLYLNGAYPQCSVQLFSSLSSSHHLGKVGLVHHQPQILYPHEKADAFRRCHAVHVCRAGPNRSQRPPRRPSWRAPRRPPQEISGPRLVRKASLAPPGRLFQVLLSRFARPGVFGFIPLFHATNLAYGRWPAGCRAPRRYHRLAEAQLRGGA